MKKITNLKVYMVFVLLLTFNALPAGALDVYDANNQNLGTLLDTSGPYSLNVFISSIGAVATLALHPNKAQSTIGWNSALSSVWYESSDCSGTPYASKMSATYPILSSVGDKYFILDYKNPKKTITPQSILMGMGCIKYSRGKACDFYPVLEIPSSSIPFTLPIATPVHFLTTP